MDTLAAALDSAKSIGAWPQMLSDMVPVPSDALSKPQAPASAGEVPPVAAHHSLARTLPGFCGWVAGQWRPDVWFAFIAISQQISANFTAAVWR